MRQVPLQEMVPHFLVVGVQKGGTTTLHSLLKLHPEIFLPDKKELHFFSLNYDKGLPWYSSHFSEAYSHQIAGEVTPYYLFHPYVAERILKDLGQIKVIVLLRDPVARLVSHYKHSVRLGFEELGLCEAIKKEPERLKDAFQSLEPINGRHKNHQELSYVSRSLYRSQIDRYWTLMRKENVLVLPSETFFQNPWSILQRIYNFLELPIPPAPTDNLLKLRANQSKLSSREILTSDLINFLRSKLDDSYDFAENELGWGYDIPWHWS